MFLRNGIPRERRNSWFLMKLIYHLYHRSAVYFLSFYLWLLSRLFFPLIVFFSSLTMMRLAEVFCVSPTWRVLPSLLSWEIFTWMSSCSFCSCSLSSLPFHDSHYLCVNIFSQLYESSIFFSFCYLDWVISI